MNNIIDFIKNDEVIAKILPLIGDTEAYLVGGYVRDLLLGKTSPDRDIIVVHDNIREFCKKIGEELNATFIELDPEWGIYRLVLENKTDIIDFACAVENNIEKDLKRRDITINSIAVSLKDFNILDLNNGISDFENKIIRAINETNLVDDPLRLLRIFRFESMLGFKIDTETLNFVKKHAQLIINPAKERINNELLKLFEGENASKALISMDEAEILENVFPFVKEIKKIPPNTHHHLDLFHHCIQSAAEIENLFSTLPSEAKEILNSQVFGSVKKIAFLKLAAFMHDIGKPKTWTIEPETGRHRFIMHDDIGAKLASPILKRLKFSKRQISYIFTMIKYHIYPSIVSIENEKAVMKFFRKLNNNVVDIIVLAMADRLSARGPDITEEIVNNNLNNLNYLMNKYFESLEALKPLPKLLSGNEIVEILDIPPSPKLGEIINALKEEQENGEISTKQQAIEFVKNFK